MSWIKKIKKAVSKAVNKVTGGNPALNAVVGLGLAPVTGGASLNVTNQANRMEAAHQERKAAQQQASAEAKAADEENRNFITKVNQQRQALLDRTKTDYTGDLTDDYEYGVFSSTKLLDRPLLTKRRKLLGM